MFLEVSRYAGSDGATLDSRKSLVNEIPYSPDFRAKFQTTVSSSQIRVGTSSRRGEQLLFWEFRNGRNFYQKLVIFNSPTPEICSRSPLWGPITRRGPSCAHFFIWLSATTSTVVHAAEVSTPKPGTLRYYFGSWKWDMECRKNEKFCFYFVS